MGAHQLLCAMFRAALVSMRVFLLLSSSTALSGVHQSCWYNIHEKYISTDDMPW